MGSPVVINSAHFRGVGGLDEIMYVNVEKYQGVLTCIVVIIAKMMVKVMMIEFALLTPRI